MRSFAEELRWTPSYEIQGSFGVNVATDHLIVEHGLENAATISFLKAPYRAAELEADQLRALLAISYNNLIEWHLFISGSDIRWINNLADRSKDIRADRVHLLSPSNFDGYASALRLDELGKAETVRRSLKACDEALLQVIARWKLLLTADYPAVGNRNLSALFNALILVRGCEDRDLNRVSGSSRLLLQVLDTEGGSTVDLLAVLRKALQCTGVGTRLSEFVSEEVLAPFRATDRATASNLLRELYSPREAAYDFNFALMSKHALSRIYEKYVALLRSDKPDAGADGYQLTFVNPVPTEVASYKTGAVYTPQFIAGFFARFIRENTTPRKFREMRSIDPACGSGIFLRTILELQCDPSIPGTTSSTITRAFSPNEGIDKDINAYEATRLSLYLLNLGRRRPARVRFAG